MCGFSTKSEDKKDNPEAAIMKPSNPTTSMETQSSNAAGGDGKRRKRNRNRKLCCCCCFTLLLLLLLFVILLTLSLTIFKPKRPIITIDSITVNRLHASFTPLNLRVTLNLTLNVDVSLKNPNRVGFSYDSSSALLNYRGQLIGEAPLPAQRIEPRKTEAMNLTLTLMADRLLSESELLSDVMSGEIPLNTFVKVEGKVRVLKVFNIKLESSSSCDLVISVSNRNVTSQHCKYSTKL